MKWPSLTTEEEKLTAAKQIASLDCACRFVDTCLKIVTKLYFRLEESTYTYLVYYESCDHYCYYFISKIDMKHIINKIINWTEWELAVRGEVHLTRNADQVNYHLLAAKVGLWVERETKGGKLYRPLNNYVE